MKRSIKTQFSWIFILILAGNVILCMVLNLFFLKQFYFANKRKSINDAYEVLNQASIDRRLMDSDFHEELLVLCETSDLSIIVLDNNANVIASLKSDDKNLLGQMIDPSFMFVNKDDPDYLQVHNVQDTYSNNKYLEMRGYLANNEPFLIRCSYISVEDNVAISNKFICIVGLFALTVGALFIIFFTNRITKPILRLTEISSRMKDLDFDAKFEPQGKTEIDVLGENMNDLSDKLEKTISELKSANNELLRDIEKKDRNEEMRKEFIANVSHELKTPIALIQSYSEGLKEGIIDDEESRDYYLDVIIDESNRMNNLVKDLMTLSELEFGNKPIEIERFNIVEMINNKISSSSILLKQNDITLEFENSEEEIFVWADEFKTEEVLENYISNAIHYCEGEKKIIISLEKKEETVRINVFNTGSKINDEDADRIWEKFYKADRARSRDYGGTGIGLSIVKAIMTSINMAYGSSNEENGVNFYFELPIK